MFILGAGSFKLNTETDPWTVDVLDSQGNVIMRVPTKRILSIVDFMTKQPTGIAVDIEG